MKKFVKIGMIGAGIAAVFGLVLMIAGTVMGGTLSSFIKTVNTNELVTEAAEWYEIHSSHPVEQTIAIEEYYEFHDSYMGGQLLGSWDISDVTSIDLEFSTGSLEIVPMYEGEQILLESDSSCEITDSSLNNGFLEIDVDAGNEPVLYLLVPESMMLDHVKLDADTGNINCFSLYANNLEVSMDTGSFFAENLQIDNALALDMDAGELFVYNAYCGRLNICNGAGNVSFTGRVNGDIYLDTDAGIIDVYLEAASKEYNYNLSCDLGTIYLDGNEISGWGNNYTIDNGAAQQLQAECDVGSISIDFE